MPALYPRYNLIFSIWGCYLFFVIYGSLVPLDFRTMPLDEALANFTQIQMYKLGMESRADWISNGVLYVPVGFLTAHLLMQRSFGGLLVPIFLAGLFSALLALGVEFTQIFFPPRTVSLNDLFAEFVGAAVGLILAARYSDWFSTLLLAVISNPRRLVLRLAEAYLAGYVAFSLFPYDLLLSGVELQQKIDGENWGWLIAGDQHGKVLIGFKAISEMILTLPFGLILGFRSVRHAASYRQASWLGILLGLFIEIAQLFTATGVSQGLSVATRVAGVCGGLALWRHRTNWSPDRVSGLARRYWLPLGMLYLAALVQANGWLSHSWNGIDSALAKLSELHFLPFYYHYYTTEAKALFSLTSVCLMYLPIGLLAWAHRTSPSSAFFYALAAAAMVETGKLFVQGMHPDPTNIMLGALAGWGAVHLAQVIVKAALMSSAGDVAARSTAKIGQNRSTNQSEKYLSVPGGTALGWWGKVTFLSAVAFAAYWALTFPAQPVLLCFFLAACAAAIWHRPVRIVVILPAALPIVDLATWSGRFYLDEFDLLLLICLAIGYYRTPAPMYNRRRGDTLFVMACGLVALSFSISTIRGLIPWQMLDLNAFTNYFSHFNALRIGKGALWAFLYYGLLRRFVAAKFDIKRPLAWGMLSGLVMAVAVIIWERLTFSSLFDFASDYRVTGPFSSMHMGGAYVECFLVIATPFLIQLVLGTKSLIGRFAGVALLLATTYALMVTFSRNGYAAFGVSVAVILFFAAFNPGRWQQRSIMILLLGVAMLTVAVPVFTGRFAQDRIASAGTDYAVRQAHWEDALNIRSPDWLTTLFGMGLGRYPESHYLLSSEASHAGTYQFKNEGGNNVLRLGAGDPIYVEQIVSIEPYQDYVLKLSVRASRPDEKTVVSLCEKWLLTSFNCIWIPLELGSVPNIWRNVEVAVKSGSLGDDPWYAHKQVKFSLHNPRGKSSVDIDDIRLETRVGDNLLVNGDFSKALDHWFFSADGHLQWHAKSLPVAVLFDQGWVGLIALGLFSILVVKRAAVRAWRGDLHAATVLASFTGFCVVGLFDTLLDAPRFLFLFILLGGLCGYRGFNITEQKNV